MNKKIFLLILIIPFIILILVIYQFKKNQIPEGYEVILKSVNFNNQKISLLKETFLDETIAIKNGFGIQEIISLNVPTFVREYYVDSFVFNSDKDYLLIITSWDSSPRELPDTLPEYNLYIYDGKKEINSNNQNLIWFGKWLEGGYSQEDLLYSESSKRGILLELERLVNEGRL